MGNNSMSAWIAPTPDTQVSGDLLGSFNYQYETLFDLTGFNPATARLAGRWATDDQGVDILINGVSSGQVNTALFASWTSFEITSGFVAGTNRLTFVVNNAGEAPTVNPSGVRAELWGSALLDISYSPAPPILSVFGQDTKVLISWSQPGFLLQKAPGLAGPWQDYSRGASLNGRDFSIAISPSLPAEYFRLRIDR